jgi:hypothetical protein
VQLVAHQCAQANQLVTMPKQLRQAAFGGCGNPDLREALRQQETKNEPGVALIGLLLAHLTGANLRRVTNPQFVTELGEQAFEPMDRTSRFDAYPHRLRQSAVERLGFPVFVLQPSLQQFSRGIVHHGNLLIARVKITSYNEHRSAPFFRALVVDSCQVYSGEGADAVI